MKERPIIMSGNNPKLILEGRKTQTRRIVKPTASQRQYVRDTWGNRVPSEREWNEMAGDSARVCLSQDCSTCPYGVAGDRLWVRETFRKCRFENTRGPEAFYKSDDSEPSKHKWTPSIHMPRWASRITLEITKVRVERLQDISDIDAEKEGCDYNEDDGSQTILAYHMLWDSLHGKGAWELNPFVWVLEFKKASDNG